MSFGLEQQSISLLLLLMRSSLMQGASAYSMPLGGATSKSKPTKGL